MCHLTGQGGWIRHPCWSPAAPRQPPECSTVSGSAEAAVLPCSLLWREPGGPDSLFLCSLDSYFHPFRTAVKHSQREMLKEMPSLIASRGNVWLPSRRGTGESRCNVSLLPDTLIPVSRSHHVICHEVQTAFLFNALGKLNQELVDSSLSPLKHTKSAAESLTLLSSSYWKGCIQGAVISY